MDDVSLIKLASTPAHEETARIMQICNACRYCEGFCAVFPAMERRRLFNVGDTAQLANPVSYTHLTLPTTPYV